MTYLVDVARLDIWDGSAWQPFGFAPAWLYARRTSDLPRASTTTVVADPVLSVTVLPNAVYDLDCKLPYAATTTGDLKIGWVVPSGATLDWNINSAEGNATGGTSQTYWGWQNASGTDVAGGVGAGTAMECRPFGTLVTSSSGGTFALAWAQANSDSTATVLKTNASMTLTRRV